MVIVCTLLQWWIIAVFARIILSWFPTDPDSFLAQVLGALRTVTDPVLDPVRRMMPPLQMGGMGLDLSPIVVIIGVQILIGVLCG